MRGMDKYTRIAVSSFLGMSTAYFIASQLDIDRFALKVFAMGVIGASFSLTIQSFCERMFPPEE